MSDDPFESAWRELEARWDDPDAHRKFIALCNAADALAEAGRRYRRVREQDSERREEAERRTDEILGLAMQRITALRTEPPQRRGTLLVIATLVAGAVIGASLWMLLHPR